MTQTPTQTPAQTPSPARPLILVTNDDGVRAPGVSFLLGLLGELDADVIAVCPDRPQSGKSMALTVDAPLRVTAHPDHSSGARMFSVNGTPVDCVKLALHAVVPRRPDFLFSGINHGSNAAVNVMYSGTMGAVQEATIEGIPAVGLSLTHHSLKADFSLSAPLVRRLIRAVVDAGPGAFPAGVGLNVNIPALMEPRGLKACRAARGHWDEEFQRYMDPWGRPFYMLTGHFKDDEPQATDTDQHWLSMGYISVVPTTPDVTAAAAIPQVESLLQL